MPDLQLPIPTCAICRARPVGEWGDPCADCVSAFGPMLRPNPDRPRATFDELEAGDAAVRRAYALQRSIQ